MSKENLPPTQQSLNLYTELSSKEKSLAELLGIPNKGLLIPNLTPDFTAALWIGEPHAHNESAILAVSQKTSTPITRQSGNWSIGMERLEIDQTLDAIEKNRELAKVALEAARHPVGGLQNALALLRRFANLPYFEL
ncbi:MAG: hypothetical protein ABIQ64_00735 [Candidatus Saccharimonadales bacterium]